MWSTNGKFISLAASAQELGLPRLWQARLVLTCRGRLGRDLRARRGWGGQPFVHIFKEVSPCWYDIFEERAGIAEYHGDMDRRQAEAMAWADTLACLRHEITPPQADALECRLMRSDAIPRSQAKIGVVWPGNS